MLSPVLIGDFNSIKVQLKLSKEELDAMPILFQFHKGTIKTTDDREQVKQNNNFNSIKVQLKPGSDVDLVSFYTHFNSIKVQLKHKAGLLRLRSERISIP